MSIDINKGVDWEEEYNILYKETQSIRLVSHNRKNTTDKLIEALKNVLKVDIGEREKFAISDLSHDEINSAKQLLQSIEKETL